MTPGSWAKGGQEDGEGRESAAYNCRTDKDRTEGTKVKGDGWKDGIVRCYEASLLKQSRPRREIFPLARQGPYPGADASPIRRMGRRRLEAIACVMARSLISLGATSSYIVIELHTCKSDRDWSTCGLSDNYNDVSGRHLSYLLAPAW